MAAMSNYLEAAILNHLFRGTSYSSLSNVWIGLYTAAPSDTGGGTEVSGGSYARVQVPSTTGYWSAPSVSGITSNSQVISWSPNPSADWGTVTHFGIFDAATTGNVLFWGALSASKAIVNGDSVSIQVGQLQIQIDD